MVPIIERSIRRRVCAVPIAVVVIAVALVTLSFLSTPATAGLMGRYHADGFDDTFGLYPESAAKDYSVQEIASSAPTNVIWPGEKPTFTLQFVNKSQVQLAVVGTADLLTYSTTLIYQGHRGYSPIVHVSPGDDLGSVPIELNIAPGGYQNVTITPPIPDTYGAYALVADLGVHGRALVAGCVRVPRPDTGQVQFPAFALDATNRGPEEMTMMSRLGVKGVREELPYTPTSTPDFQAALTRLSEQMAIAKQNDVTVMLTLDGGGPQPMFNRRPFLSADGHLDAMSGDRAWLPSSDPDFQSFVSILAGKFGWPDGPLNAIEVWNEPWDGNSISGWGADILRYREIYTAAALGVEQARKEYGVRVLIGGCSSSMNIDDKLFCDGTDTFLKWLDFASIHYQPMDDMPALIPEWVNRKSPYGPVQAWETENFAGQTEDMVASDIACEHAEGLSRTACVFHDDVRDIQSIRYRTANGIASATIIQTWSPAAAIAAAQKFIGQRKFNRLLFSNGLPWVFVFDGRIGGNGKPNPDDGTAVVVGDLGFGCDKDLLRYRTVCSSSRQDRVARLRREIAVLPLDTPTSERDTLLEGLRTARLISDGSMTLSDEGGIFQCYDFYGNPIPPVDGKITVPLNGTACFLRTDGSPGSFAKLIQAIQSSRVQGYEPVEIIAHDLLAPVDTHPTLQLTLTDILNRSVTGTLSVTLGDLTFANPEQAITLQPGETKDVSITVTTGKAVASNTYPLTAIFDAGADGKVTHIENMHVNLIAHRTITVDGNLKDWQGVLPQPVSPVEYGAPVLPDQDYNPATPFGPALTHNFAIAYLSYDADNFYFAAKVADDTPYDGNVRFATRDDNSYFYPDKVYETIPAAAPQPVDLSQSLLNIFKEGANLKPPPPVQTGPQTVELTWPAGVRHYTYRKHPDIPSGDGTDNIILGFGVLPEGQNGSLLNPPGTMPRFMCYKCTDYEYALNQVAQQYGGGTEVWRLIAPGVPRKHYYPREPKAPIDGGPVTNAQLVIKRVGNTRIVECSLPWTEIPDVKNKLDAGQPIRFTFRVNDNGQAESSYELAGDRSVSKIDNYSLHPFWMTHWANEVQFAFEK